MSKLYSFSDIRYFLEQILKFNHQTPVWFFTNENWLGVC